jgi:hypothetical protein
LNSLWAEVRQSAGRWMTRCAAKMLAATLVIAVSGCAGMAPKGPEEAVKERAQARWNALVQGDYKAAYGYLSPGSRAVQSEKDYVNSLRQGFWKSARVEKATCTEQRCQVLAAIEYELQGRRTTTPLQETWIREGSEWWYVAR